MATEDQIDRATDRLLEAVEEIRAEVAGDDQELVVRQAAFLLAVRLLGGREGLAQAAMTCGEQW